MSRNPRIRKNWMFYLERYAEAAGGSDRLEFLIDAKQAQAHAWFDRAIPTTVRRTRNPRQGRMGEGGEVVSYRYVPTRDPIAKSCSYWDRHAALLREDGAFGYRTYYSEEEVERMVTAQEADDAADPPCGACLRCAQSSGEP